MTVVVAGATGFIGSWLSHRLAEQGISVVALTRNPEHRRIDGVKFVPWDGKVVGEWRNQLDGSEGVVNLSGEVIGRRRWTPAEKALLFSSRIDPTNAIVQAIKSVVHKPRVLVNASAVGFYGSVESDEVAETRPGGKGFLADLCRAWEHEAFKATSLGVRVVVLRTGIVLGNHAGALPRMMLPFKFFAGGPIGSGNQWFPWVHGEDLVESIVFALTNESLRGPVNVVAPGAVTMREFSTTLGKILRRPSWLPLPVPLLRLALGEMSEMLLTGQRAVPAALEGAGFHFRFPLLRAALEDLLGPDS